MESRTTRILGCIALVIAARGASAATPTTAGADQIVKLYSSGPRALAMLTLGDGPPAPVVFDTGEDKAFLVTPYAKRLALKVIGTTPLVDEATGARSTVPLAQLPSPQLSGVDLNLTQAKILDYQEPDMVGVFGPGAFQGRLVTLELSRHRVRLSALTPETLPRGTAYPYFHEIPAMTIDVAGLPVVAHLDSGSTMGLSMSKSLMTKVKLKSPPVVVGQAVSVSGAQDVYGSQIDGDVRIGPLVLHDPQVVFGGAGVGANVGYDIMRNLTIVMDPAGQRSWVLDPSDVTGALDQFTGRFGERTVTVADGKLIYQRDGRPAYTLKYLGGDLFEITETGDEVQFHRTGTRVTDLELITDDGQTLTAKRDDAT